MSAALDLAVLPETDWETALEASRAVARLTGHGAVQVEAVPVDDKASRQTFVLPAGAVQMLMDILAYLGSGTPVSIIPNHAELTTHQAAEVLNVSRPWVIKLIERGELPHRMVGTHRRVLFADLLAHKGKMKAVRSAALDRLAAEAQAMGDYE